MKETKIDYGYFDIDLIKIWDKVAIAIIVVLDYNYDCLQKDMVVSNLKLKVIVILIITYLTYTLIDPNLH